MEKSSGEEKRRAIKVILTCVVALLIVGHIWKPNLKIDSITIALLVLGTLPWLYSFVESAKFPGGWEVKFRDIEKAAEKISLNGQMAGAHDDLETFDRIRDIDPNLAIVSLRLEIEKRVRKIAENHEIKNGGPLMTLIRTLSSKTILPDAVVDGLLSLVRLGNDAVHGAKVDPAAADLAFRVGPEINKVLDAYIEK